MPKFNVHVTRQVHELFGCTFEVEADNETAARVLAEKAMTSGTGDDGEEFDYDYLRSLGDEDGIVEIDSIELSAQEE